MHAEADTGYRVRLDRFEGPLDLLLYLIRRAEVDITDIPMATITDQFLDHLERIEQIDIDVAGEFLVMAATLMEIKSRMINPEPVETRDSGERDSGDDADPRQDLVSQLLEYKRYRDAARGLGDRMDSWASRAGVTLPAADDDAVRASRELFADDMELEELGLNDLVEAFGRILDSVNFERLGEHEIVSDETPIEIHAEDILDRLSRDGDARGSMSLAALVDGRAKAEVIGVFLAMLTLIRDQRVAVAQETLGGEIVLVRRSGEDSPDADQD